MAWCIQSFPDPWQSLTHFRDCGHKGVASRSPPAIMNAKQIVNNDGRMAKESHDATAKH